ncbi:DUF2934 domain-containing protein [Neorhizobium lilium]|uniref:DUF2934 domain-containing protein n=1 Tax=Neorhizobium lilium TaxID=2503024 RepID=A0A444LNC7_9HYPH|nr:DUF2934 domain-containing protein [Neorhizobium lilium]RWX81804.1 DUF2934 domain-containing protein [Neorhizobium lilium]
MENDREQQIRERAYALWEQEGRPQGDDLRHWLAALTEFGAEGQAQDTMTENTSVLGDPEGDAGAADIAANRGAKSSQAMAQITTGEEDSHSAVQHAEGP